MGLNVAITSLYTGLAPGVNTIANLSMWWPESGSPTPAEYTAIRTGGMCWYLRQQKPKGCRTIWLNNFLMWELVGADPCALIRDGVDVSRTLSGLKPLSKHLKYAKLPPDLVFVDVEANFSYFATTPQKIQQILRDPACRTKLPTYVKQIDPSIFDRPSDPALRDAILKWSRFAARWKLDLIKRVVVDSGLFDIPDQSGVIRRSPVVNFFYQQQRWSMPDLNGWASPSMTVDGKSSNPAVYLYTADGNWLSSFTHHSLWNRLIYAVNTVRTSLGIPGHRVWPILDRPGARHPWVWEQLVAHCIRAGITLNNGQWFLYWNPWQYQSDDNIATEVLARHDQPWPLAGALPRIPYDVDEFETNGFVTRYTDFLDQVEGTANVVGADVEGDGSASK